MEVFGEKLKKDELFKKIGDITQICDIKSFEYNDGVSKGIRAININNSISGINITVLIDRGLDISYLSYKSIPLGFKTKVKETSLMYFDSKGLEFLRTFYAGFLTTCGLSSIGWPSEDNGEEFGLHDRISNIGAEKVLADIDWIDDANIFIQGKVREAKWLGDYLELSRKVKVFLDEPVIVIEDCVENIGYRESPLMILYHFNLGFPMLDRGARLFIGRAKTIAGDKNSEKYINEYNIFTDPVDNFSPQLFYHDINEDSKGNCNIVFSNPSFDNRKGIGLWISYNKENLLCLNQMKNMSFGEYICSIEPGSNFVRGREIEKSMGRLRTLKPGEKAYFKIKIKILASNMEIINLLDYLGFKN